MNPTERGVKGAWWVLRTALGVGMLLAGLDKFFDLLASWSMYLSPLAERLLPVGAATFLRGVGILEMVLGIAVLTRFTRLGAYACAAWLLAIAVNLAVTGNLWDPVLRDLQNALAAFALGRLTEARTALDGSAQAS